MTMRAEPVVYGSKLCRNLDDYARAFVEDWISAGDELAPADVEAALDDLEATARIAYAVHVEWRAAAMSRGDPTPPLLTVARIREALRELGGET